MMRGAGLLTLVLLTTFSTACAAPWAPPTPAEILAKPANSGMKDGHFKLTGHITSGSFAVDVTGDGIMIIQPRYALSLHIQGSLGQLPFAVQSVEVNGKTYSRVGNQKWSEADAKSEPGSASGATVPTLIGEEALAVGKSWHVRAKDSSGQPFDTWVRQSDGYLAKYSGSTASGSLSMEFDKYNTGDSVVAPPASDIKPPARDLRGKVGDAMQLNGLTVIVLTADLNAKPTDAFFGPKAGNRWVVIQVLYENTGSDNVAYNPYDWKLVDSSGFSYSATYTGIGPELHSGDISTGGKARGYISYEVPQSAGGLTLKFQHGDDSTTVTIN